MFESDEARRLASAFSDRSRKAFRIGREVAVPHKFKETGQVVSTENFNPRSDVSRLSLDHWRLLEQLQLNGWDLAKSCEALSIDLEKGKKLEKKLKYFRYEKAKESSMVKMLTPDFVAAKHMENVYTGQLDDSQRDSLDKLGKITGAYKSAETVNIQQNVFNLPRYDAATEAKLREIADREASIIQEAKIVNPAA